MRADFKHNAFLAGEMSKAFEARTDLGKYDLGLSLCNNYYVDFRGGVRTRGGMAWQDYADGAMKLLEFKLGAGTSSILIIATALRFRFFFEGAYLTDSAIAVASAVGTLIGTGASHGLTTGNFVVLTGADASLTTYQVTSTPTSTSFTAVRPNGTVPDLAGTTLMQRVQEVSTPYTADDIGALHVSQDYLTLRIFHLSHYPQELKYDLVAQTWSLENLPVGAQILAPVGLRGTPAASGTARVVFAITAVNSAGEESLASSPIIIADSIDYTYTAGSLALEWEAQSDAAFYRIYRSIITDNPALDVRAQLGLLGETITPSFVDNNIVPDFTISPPLHNNPFLDGVVEGINISAQGAGYLPGTTLVCRDLRGSGFSGAVTVNAGGGITAVTVETGGSGYISPHFFIFSDSGMGFVGKATIVAGVITAVAVVKNGIGYAQGTLRIRAATYPDLIILPVLRSGALVDMQVIAGGSGLSATTPLVITTGAGAGAVCSISITSPIGGNNPRTGMKFQQRQLYAGTNNLPNILIGSKPGAPVNFDYSGVANAGDSYVFALDNESIVPIKHLLRQKEGLLIMHEQGIDHMKAQNGIAITAVDKFSEPQTSVGVSDLVPLKIDNDLLYATANGAGIQTVTYTLYNNSFTSANLSILAPHLFGTGQTPVAWVWDESPDRLVWLVRSDGRFLSLTYLKDQEIFAWARHETTGKVLDICSTSEANERVIYFGVKRATGYFIEKQIINTHQNIEDYVGVDASLTYQGDIITSTLEIVEAGDVAIISGVTAGAADWIIRAAGGIYKITSLSGTLAICALYSPATILKPGTISPLAESWSVTLPVTTVSGLWHLEGQFVSALLDGDPYSNLLVTEGAVTFPVAGSLIHIGLPYTARLETLPLFNADMQTDGKWKRVVGAQFMLENTRGLLIGILGQELYEIKDSSFTLLNGPLDAADNPTSGLVASSWAQNQRLVCQQSYPLPASVLAFFLESEFGI